MDERRTNIVIGLGEIGKPLYTLIARKDPTAKGIDIDPVTLDGKAGIMHVCFPFQLKNGFVETILDYVRKYSPQIIVINSTVSPGTTDTVAQRSGIPTVYSPVRGKHTRMESDLLHYQKFVAGANPAAVEQVRAQFAVAGFKVTVLSSARVLELAKLLETSYFGLLIAWAQEMDRLAQQVGGDYFEMAKFFEEIPYLPPVIFKPGYIGGHCVMPNIEILRGSFGSQFFDVISVSNEQKAKELKNAADLAARVEPLQVSLRSKD